MTWGTENNHGTPHWAAPVTWYVLYFQPSHRLIDSLWYSRHIVLPHFVVRIETADRAQTAVKMPQDMPPAGGYLPVQYKVWASPMLSSTVYLSAITLDR